MEFEWNEAKRQSNLAKHGLDFADISAFDWDFARFEDDTLEGENRTKAVGFLRFQVVVVIFTLRDNVCRIISLRKATAAERRHYERYQI